MFTLATSSSVSVASSRRGRANAPRGAARASTRMDRASIHRTAPASSSSAAAAAPHGVDLARSTLPLAMSAAILLTGVSPAAVVAADTAFCQAKCVKECLRIAPGSDGYCTDACSDECDAMAADGDDISENSTSSVFASKKDSSGVEGMLVGIIDKSAVLFAPGAELAKDPACGPDE